MLLSREQVAKLHQAFEEDPRRVTVILKDRPNGSGIGPDTEATFYGGGLGWGLDVLGTLDITDVSLW